ncbi:MAG: hypothetical protein A2381_16170 [Bdellovibrionales bacterium RIFOXYB1_FULL_37_110]|nr:MAG: hypothetical protein A2417_08020 [Bdellovibrionales bacterium RIFOXYC1_FULL_37_79]OFZ57149.1 MAG: hypothetical protein A2381_16170 [Bdellovibrionales bacterium RIFOXYB1_FULL_37_110]OFZ65367.1 MAG: hypothetical protein A2577_03700 [Bdellovibrionales bacterium RIFOXYD1_FULL_36_51]
MKNIIILITLAGLISCGNKLKQANAYKNPIVDQNDNQAQLALMQARGKYSEKTSSVVIFHWAESIDWETDYFNNLMDLQTKKTRQVEGVTYYSERHDETDSEMYKIGKQLKVWEDNECFIYDSIDEDDIPQICVDMWDEARKLEDRKEYLLKNVKPGMITNIMRLLDADAKQPVNWKILDDDGDDSIIAFDKDWRVIKRFEINKFGPNKVNYTLENGGIRNLEVASNYRISFYLYEREINDGLLTGNVYKYVLDQDANFIEKHRLKGKIHKYDLNLNLVKEDIGICKIEFNNENK